jgi:hypothetical protein
VNVKLSTLHSLLNLAVRKLSGGSAGRVAPAEVPPEDDELEGEAGEAAVEAETFRVLARYARANLHEVLKSKLDKFKELLLPGHK